MISSTGRYSLGCLVYFFSYDFAGELAGSQDVREG